MVAYNLRYMTLGPIHIRTCTVYIYATAHNIGKYLSIIMNGIISTVNLTQFIYFIGLPVAEGQNNKYGCS